MDIQPGQSVYSDSEALFQYPIVAYQTALSDPFTLLSQSIKTFNPWPITSNEPVFIVPSMSNLLAKAYECFFLANLVVFPTNAANDYYGIPGYLNQWGNVLLGSSRITINGAPLGTAFVTNSDYFKTNTPITRISVPVIEAEYSVDLSNLQATATFTPDPAANDWIAKLFLKVVVKAST